MSLADLIEAARHRKMTPEEIFEQKVSFIWGMQKLREPGYTKEEIRHLLLAQAPSSETRAIEIEEGFTYWTHEGHIMRRHYTGSKFDTIEALGPGGWTEVP